MASERQIRTCRRDRVTQHVVIPPDDSDDSNLPESNNEDEDYVGLGQPATARPRPGRRPSISSCSDDNGSSSDEDQLPGNARARPLIWKQLDNDPITAKAIPAWQYTYDTDSIEDPMEYFHHYFDDDVLDHIVEQSNLYAIQVNPNKPHNLNKSELEQFIGMVVFMSIFDLHRVRAYWAKESRVPQVADVMSRDRFLDIKKYLHFNDNTNMPVNDVNRDRIFKIRPLVDMLVNRCQNNAFSGQMLSVDEQIVPFRGRSSLKQYNPSKPHKWGYKIFALCDVKGFVYNFDIYTGKIEAKDFHRDIGASSNVVLQLANIIPQNQGFLLYCDNWFTSTLLMVELNKKGIGALGTVRCNRLQNCLLIPDAELKKKGRGSYQEKETTVEGVEMRAIKWLDSKPVTLLTTFSSAHPIGITERYDRKKKEYVEVQKPSAVNVYNTFMGGVDLLDAQIAYYRIKLRSKKYYMWFFFHFLDLVVVNSWLKYRQDCKGEGFPTKHWLDQFEFRLALADSLCRRGKDLSLSRKRGRPNLSVDSLFENKCKRGPAKPIPNPDVRRDCVGHWPEVNEKRQRCKNPMCKGITVVRCIKCDVHLCLNKTKNCFQAFHQ